MRHPAATQAVAATDHHHLVDQVDQPGDPSTLVDRTFDWLWSHRAVLDDPSRHPAGYAFLDVLDALLPSVARLWRARAAAT
jgi:hypothetical protein